MVYDKKQEVLTPSRAQRSFSSGIFGGIRVAHLFSFMYNVVFLFFFFSFRVLSLVVSLDCPLLIVKPFSDFSHVYITLFESSVFIPVSEKYY